MPIMDKVIDCVSIRLALACEQICSHVEFVCQCYYFALSPVQTVSLISIMHQSSTRDVVFRYGLQLLIRLTIEYSIWVTIIFSILDGVLTQYLLNNVDAFFSCCLEKKICQGL